MNASFEKPFAGNPRLYRRITILGPLALNLYLYGGMVAIVYLLKGETWIFGWQAILATGLFTLFLMRISYPWIMNLDARYGSGSSWSLETQKIKLPQKRQKTEKAK